MESEVDLDEEIKKIQALASQPELYPEFVRLGAVPSLLVLLNHENEGGEKQTRAKFLFFPFFFSFSFFSPKVLFLFRHFNGRD
jgi:hypothetical protein